jgi:hypothetical protein
MDQRALWIITDGGGIMIRITSRQNVLHRCRVPHPKGTTEYPDDMFSKAQIKILQAEPKLTVEIIEDGEQIEGTEEERPDLKVWEIKERLTEMGVEFPSRAKKEELQKLLVEKMKGF